MSCCIWTGLRHAGRLPALRSKVPARFRSPPDEISHFDPSTLAFLSSSALACTISSSLPVSDSLLFIAAKDRGKSLLTHDLPLSQLLNTCPSPPPFDQVHATATVAISRDENISTPPTIIIHRSTSQPWPVPI